MQVLNLIRPEKSYLGFTLSRFPDGEVHVTLGEINHKDKVQVVCRITNAEELFILMQVCDILRRHGVIFNISIYYLMSMRMDRVMDFNRPFSLSLVCNVLDTLGAFHIEIFSPHSNEYLYLMRNTLAYELYISDEASVGLSKYQLLFPDAGAKERYSSYTYSGVVITCSKVRDLATGNITGIKIDNPEIMTDTPILILDDLCDGGRTFVEIAKAVRAVKPNAELNIFVKHMVNPKGIENLSKTFNHVWFTNSYKDWRAEFEKQSTSLPENVTQIDIV